MDEQERQMELFMENAEPPSGATDLEAAPVREKQGIKKVSITHDVIILWLLHNPHRSVKDCAEYFGYSANWMYCITKSDAFRARYEESRGELTSHALESISGKLEGAAQVALDRLAEKIGIVEDPRFLLDATDTLLHRLGYAPKVAAQAAGTTNITNNVVVNSVDPELLRGAREKMANQGKLLAAPGIEDAQIVEESANGG